MTRPMKHVPSVNQLAAPLVEYLVDHAAELRLAVSRQDNGVRIVDAGIQATGGIEAGRRIAEICLGGLGRVTLALGSGPGRALAGKEELFAELAYRDRADSACLVLETDKIPPLPLLDKIAGQCDVSPDRLTLILTPTTSLAGSVQVVARVLEVALHKAHFLGFPLDHIVDGMGTAPVCPPSPDFLTAMGRTNDAILFGGRVQLFVAGEETAAEALAQRMPSEASKDYGQPFAQVFKAAGHDFYKIDPLLFAPAQIIVTCLGTGRSFRAGQLNADLLERSFS